jgi:translocation and assembly module TamB
MAETLSTPVKFTLILLLVLLLVVLGAAGVLLGMAGSEGGTRLLLGQAGRWLGDTVSWQTVEGSLRGPLRLSGVRIAQPGMELAADTLTFDWNDLDLLRERVQIDALEVSGIRVALSPVEPTEPAGPLPTPAQFRPPVDIILQGVRLRDLSIVQDGQPPVQIDEVDLDARLEGGELSLERLAVRLPAGGVTLSGTTTLDDDMPLALQADWDWRLPAADDDSVPSAPSPEGIPLAGSLALDGRIDWRDAIAVDLEYRLEARGLDGIAADLPAQTDLSGAVRGRYLGDALELEQLGLALADTPLALSLRGRVAQLDTDRPAIDATVAWEGVQWPLEGDEPLVASERGTLQLAGSPDAYDVEIDADLAGSDIPESTWQGSGSGDAAHIRLDRLQGRLLDGTLEIAGPLSWDPAPRWALVITGSELDPGGLVPEFPGRLALELAIDGKLDPDQGLMAELAVSRVSGTLAGYPLNLMARARLLDGAVQLDSLDLDAGGNRLNASGRVSPDALALAWDLQADAPQVLLPGASGTLAASGSVEGSPESPRVVAQLAGDSLGLEELRVETVSATLEAGLAADAPLSIDLRTGPVHQGDQEMLASLRLQARGTNSRHRLDLELASADDQLLAGLEGGLADSLDAWQGQLLQLAALSGQYGHWQLAEPAALSLSATAATLGNSCLQAEGDAGRVCLAGDWHQAGDIRLTASLGGIPLEQWVPAVTGAIDGELAATLGSNGALLADGALRLAPGLVEVQLEQGAKQLAHGGGDLALKINADGLATRLNFAAPEQGRVAVDVQLPALTALPLAETQPLRGAVRATLPDLGGLAALVPDLDYAAGRLYADLALTGTLDQPGLEGELSLRDGAADIPMAGLQLRQITLLAVTDPAQPGQLQISGGLLSEPGHLDISGRLDLADQILDLGLQGERLLVYDTPDARALLSPDLQVGWRDGTLKLRGRLVVPEASITPQLALTPAAASDTGEAEPGQAIAPSPDVVVLGAEPEVDESLKAPFRIDSRVELVLGDRVDVRAVGLISRVAGAVTFVNTPDQVDLLPVANGRLSLEEGTFRAFGQNLDIQTGQVIFANAPVTEPELNIRAVRWIDNDPEVTAAGVVLAGPVAEPSLTLISNPQMETPEIQSYLLTGRPPGENESVLSVGTYLSPRFYVGYGFNLMDSTSEFNSLFNITPRYGLGVDLGEADSNVSLTITHEH